jgi:diaminopimelate epimerase
VNIPFAKYHGAGNDFILIDNREGRFFLDDPALIRRLCHRQIGIGADGVLLIETSALADVKMRIYNRDASIPAMCGNGIRCAFDFAAGEAQELTIEVSGRIFSCRRHDEHVLVNLGAPRLMHWPIETDMQPIYVLDTGVPHALVFVKEILEIPFLEWAQHIRFHPAFGQEGVNVNAVEIQKDGGILLRTYERGVERETLACGTGAAAAAFAAAELYGLKGVICVKTRSPQGDDFVPSLKFRISLRAREEINSQSETVRKLPRIDDHNSVHISNIDRLAIVDPRGFGAVSDAEVIYSRALRQIEMIGPACRSFTGEFDLKLNPVL